MTDDAKGESLRQVKRELDLALAAVETGAGARATLECRVADLQQRLIATPAASLADVRALAAKETPKGGSIA